MLDNWVFGDKGMLTDWVAGRTSHSEDTPTPTAEPQTSLPVDFAEMMKDLHGSFALLSAMITGLELAAKDGTIQSGEIGALSPTMDSLATNLHKTELALYAIRQIANTQLDEARETLIDLNVLLQRFRNEAQRLNEITKKD